MAGSPSVIGCSPRARRGPRTPARIADSTLSATSDRPRELNRWNSAADRTGTGTPSSIAALIVQRPSPESLMVPSNRSRCGSTARAWAVRSSSQLEITEPAPPHLGDRGEVEVVLVVLGVGQRCRLGVGGVRLQADVGLGQHVEALGVGGHQPVLDAVVDHLDEVAGAARTAVQPAPLGSSTVDRRLRRCSGVRAAASTPGARASKIGASRSTASDGPPTIRQ